MDAHVEKDEALLGRLLTNPAEVETLSDDQQVSELLAEVVVRHAQLSTLHLSLLSRLIKVRRQPLQAGATSENDRLLSVDEAAEPPQGDPAMAVPARARSAVLPAPVAQGAQILRGRVAAVGSVTTDRLTRRSSQPSHRSVTIFAVAAC